MPGSSRLTEVVRAIESWIEPNGVTCAGVVVRSRGELIADHFAGEGQPGRPVDERTLFALASVTKPVTASAVMALVDDGLLSIDEPIARFVPEFATAAPDGNGPWEAGRRLITVRQALGHTTGLPEDLAPGTLRGRDMPSVKTITDHLIRLPLGFEPGTELRYSNAGYALLGRLVERITGRDLWDYARDRILDPMDLSDIIARPDESEDDRIAQVGDAGGAGTEHEGYQSRYWREMAIPWGGIFGTPRDIARFAESFMLPTNAPLSRTTRRLMITDQAGGVSGGLTSLKLTWHPASWGLGWEVKGSKSRHWTGELTSPATYCHWGAAGTLVWADPEQELTVAMFGNRTTFNLWPFVPVARWSRLSNAIIAAMDTER
jgi:beta-lactamase class C